MALNMGGFAGLGKRQRKGVMVCWAENRRVRERVAGMRGRDEGAQVGEGSWDIRVEAGECPERA
jgi:hypothetical protein